MKITHVLVFADPVITQYGTRGALSTIILTSITEHTRFLAMFVHKVVILTALLTVPDEPVAVLVFLQVLALGL